MVAISFQIMVFLDIISTMKCWKCDFDMEDPSLGKLPFRSTCDKCGSWLHCCKNCKYYTPGLPNDCYIPGTDFVADREGCNFCEEFKLLGIGAEGKGVNPDEKKKDFDSLFKDD